MRGWGADPSQRDNPRPTTPPPGAHAGSSAADAPARRPAAGTTDDRLTKYADAYRMARQAAVLAGRGHVSEEAGVLAGLAAVMPSIAVDTLNTAADTMPDQYGQGARDYLRAYANLIAALSGGADPGNKV